ncbi:MAG: carbon storage regulator [Fuerstiella sp.]|nr:carbon storage regulator [Fuerstiella sp.]
MLVLSRKSGESIQIADNISVTVSHVRRGRVRLSIDAPQSIRIVRKEIVTHETAPCDDATTVHTVGSRH